MKNINEVISDGKSIYREKRTSLRPQSLHQVQNSVQEASSNHVNKGAQRISSGVDFFRSNFGELQGEDLYAQLETKYGKEKMKAYQPQENNGKNQTYAQVVKQLNVNKQSSLNTQMEVGRREESRKNMKKQATKVRKKDEQ